MLGFCHIRRLLAFLDQNQGAGLHETLLYPIGKEEIYYLLILNIRLILFFALLQTANNRGHETFA